jgi:hypothetical protein
MASETEDDHDRVMAIPAYKRWYDGQDRWADKFRWRMEARARTMREREFARHKMAIDKINEWERTHASREAAHEAWRIADEKRYWPLRRV